MHVPIAPSAAGCDEPSAEPRLSRPTAPCTCLVALYCLFSCPSLSTVHPMLAQRVAALAAVGAVTAWALKAAAIAAAGGLDQSPLEGPLFVIGFVLIMTAFGTAGWALATTRSVALRVLAAIVGLVVGFVAFIALETAVGAVVPDSAGWVKEEAGLWVVSAVNAAIMLTWWRSTARSPAEA